MSKIWQQLASIWNRLEIQQRATIVLVILAFVGVAIVLVVGATRPDYRLLARDLTRSQVSEIASYLDSVHVQYQVADHETSILVPSKNLYRLRNDLAEHELLGDGSKGFEILAKGNMWDSTFSEHKTYDRAVSGELERSFRELPGVRSARVLIDRPQPSPFLGDDSAKPKASIKLDMKPGQRLTARQVAGVLHLAAGAVAGLTPERVEIVDGTGLLTPAGADSGAQMAQTTLDAEAAREAYLTRKAQEQLDTVLGPGRSSVKVGVKLDFTKRSLAKSDPTTTKALLKEHSKTTDEKNPLLANGGVAGTAPNVEGEGTATATTAPVGTKTSEETTNDYVVGKSTLTQEDEVGLVKGMNVSILLDYKTTKVPKLDAKGQPTAEMVEKREEYSESEKLRFQELVTNAIGFNAAKGAQTEAPEVVKQRFTVTVQSMELWREPAEVVAATVAPSLPAALSEYAGYILAGLVALVVLLVARGQLKRSHRAWAEAEARARQAAEAAHRPAEGAEAENERRRVRRQGQRDEIKRRVNEDPASAAQIVRQWLYEG
jgi:flagellar M-ring protein FliF